MVSVSLLYQDYVSNTRPKILGIITKILYSSNNINFKGSFLCDKIPRIIINKGSSLLIENNVYLRADVEIRAKRRDDQYLKKNSNLNLSDIIDDLTKRDYIDKNRQLSPLVSAKDAYLLDTSNITSDDGLKKIIQIISKKLEK